ncbi:hypothetical protein PsorP6_012562 [Peronosclerospora sorghi]|uniref:Uncharacterized protein n=1 Tax=Peronosclerospora sorghi TaxID=230839 RepID=A0ACC0WGV1_9STRA|nr:hypothetical protein PsorP6_012562 [Peronosclerospora sorghi]
MVGTERIFVLVTALALAVARASTNETQETEQTASDPHNVASPGERAAGSGGSDVEITIESALTSGSSGNDSVEQEELVGSYSGSMEVADIEEVVDEEDVLDATDDDENDEYEADQMVETDEEDGKKEDKHVAAINATSDTGENAKSTKVVQDSAESASKDVSKPAKDVAKGDQDSTEKATHDAPEDSPDTEEDTAESASEDDAEYDEDAAEDGQVNAGSVEKNAEKTKNTTDVSQDSSKNATQDASEVPAKNATKVPKSASDDDAEYDEEAAKDGQVNAESVENDASEKTKNTTDVAQDSSKNATQDASEVPAKNATEVASADEATQETIAADAKIEDVRDGAEQILDNLPPERQRLQHVMVLPCMRVRQSRAVTAAHNGQRPIRVLVLRIKVRREQHNHAIDRVALEIQVILIVCDRVQTLFERLARDRATRVCGRQGTSCLCFLLELALDLRAGFPVRCHDHRRGREPCILEYLF